MPNVRFLSAQIRGIPAFVLPLGAVCVLALGLAPGQVFAQPTDADQACINATHKGASSVAKARGKLVARCVKQAAQAKLSGPGIDDCVTGDDDGKVAKAASKAEAKIAAACAGAPAFGPSDLSGQTASAAASAARIDLAHDVFGDVIADAVVRDDVDEAGAKCQAAALKAFDKCWKAHEKRFSSCAKKGMASGTVTDAATLGACRSDDPKGKVAATCNEKLAKSLAKSCAELDTDTLFPGCVCQALDQCIGVGARNIANEALEVVDNLSPADPVLPFARVEQTDVGVPWIVNGAELVATRVEGFQPDAPLLCPMGAMNIHTINIPADDDAYNAIALPLLIQQGVPILFFGESPTDLLSFSPPNLVQEQQVMPLYSSAYDILQLATRAEFFDAAPLKQGQVGESLVFGLQECLHDCAAHNAAPFLQPLGGQLLILHVEVDRATLETAVPLLAAEADGVPDLRLHWAGRSVAGIRPERADGSFGDLTTDLAADTLVYVYGGAIDPAADVLTLPVLSGLLAASTTDAAVALHSFGP